LFDSVAEKKDKTFELQVVFAESTSPWASPVVMVPKADSSLRLCTDFRKINSCTVPDHFPLPRIEDLIDHVGKTKTDQIGHDQRLLAGSIGSHFRICHPVRPFPVALYAVRASQCPCHLFSASHQVTDGLGCLLCCYLDDIYTWEEHLSRLRIVLSRIRSANLKLSPAKCYFAVAKVDYLGHHVGLGRVQPWAKKVQAVVDYPAPTTRRQLQQFLGLAGYYRKFVPHFAHISAALSDMLKKGTKFIRTAEAMKSRLVTQPI